jgi:phosphomannomutase / phosphoglucomutase
MNQIANNIFRAYDIRGIVGKELSEEVAYGVGRAFATMCSRQGLKSIAVGRDARHTGESYAKKVMEAISDTGLTAIDCGTISTPISYFAVFAGYADASCMITASHNPPEFNGYKMVMEKTKLSSDQIQDIRRMITEQDYDSGKGAITEKDLQKEYIEYITKNTVSAKPLKIVVDAGNGTGGLALPQILRNKGHKVVELYCDPDGDFPNHHPDPTEIESLEGIREKVVDEEADLGIALDGDADRLAIIDEKGNAYWGDSVVAVFAKDILSKGSGSIVYDVKCSLSLKDAIVAGKGKPIESRTGHTFISLAVKENGALMGGEMSGHIYFNDRYYGFDDAIYSGARMAELLSHSSRKASELFEKSAYLATPEVKVHVSDANKFVIMDEMMRIAKTIYPEVVDIDGVKVYTDEGWFLIRASNTQPALIVRAEGKSEEDLNALKAEIEKQLNNLLEKHNETIIAL